MLLSNIFCEHLLITNEVKLVFSESVFAMFNYVKDSENVTFSNEHLNVRPLTPRQLSTDFNVQQ